MKLLLDTVALYRVATMPETLPEGARNALGDRSNPLHVSLVSAWEIGIKAQLGKLALPCALEEVSTWSRATVASRTTV